MKRTMFEVFGSPFFIRSSAMYEIPPTVRSNEKRLVQACNINAFTLLSLIVFLLGPLVFVSDLFSQETRAPRSGSVSNSSRMRTSGFPGDDQERTRPPKPTRQRDDLHFPPGFLQLSKPTELPTESETPQESKRETPVVTEKKEVIAPVVSRDDTEPNIEPTRSGDDTILLGIVVSAALLGIFVFADYRYRCWLQSVLLQNNRLLSPDVAASDFDEIFMTNGIAPLSFAGPVLGGYPGIGSFADYGVSSGFMTPETALVATASSVGSSMAEEFFARNTEPEA